MHGLDLFSIEVASHFFQHTSSCPSVSVDTLHQMQSGVYRSTLGTLPRGYSDLHGVA